MGTFGSLQPIFEHPIPETPTLLGRTLGSSWKPMKPAKIQPIEQQSSVTGNFGELHVKEIFRHARDENEKVESTSSITTTKKVIHKKSFSLNSESLQVCTEGLGSESSASVDEIKNDLKQEWESSKEKIDKASDIINKKRKDLHGDWRVNRSRRSNSLVEFPPPITCIGKCGKPWVCLKSYRQDGRHVLKQVMIPKKEMLHACRQDGRLKLQFMQPKNKSTEQQGSEEEEDKSMEQEQEQGSEEERLFTNDEIDEGEEQRQST